MVYTYKHCLTSLNIHFPNLRTALSLSLSPLFRRSRIIWTEVPDTKTDSKLETRIGPAMGNHVSVTFSSGYFHKKEAGLKNPSCFTVLGFLESLWYIYLPYQDPACRSLPCQQGSQCLSFNKVQVSHARKKTSLDFP